MKKKLATIFLPFFLLACGFNKKNKTVLQPVKSKTIEVVSENDTLTVQINDSINLSLYTNPSTGYFWEWVNNHNEHIDSVYNTFISEDNPHNYDGLGGVDKWSFKAKKKGFDSIVMIYHRTGEFDNAFYKKHFIKIN